MTESGFGKIQLLIAGAAMIGVLSTVYIEAPSRHPRPTDPISVGVKLRAPNGYRWPSNASTLVLVLRVGCGHCENEMSFYERLLDLERTKDLRIHLVAFMPNSETQIREAFAGRLVGLEKVAGAEMPSLKVRGTPTLILVDASGEVKSTWVGEIRPEEKQAMINTFTLGDVAAKR